MSWSSLQLRNLVFLGPKKSPADMNFNSGVNVICGASDTGKSFIVEAIDFYLGGTKLRDIPERVGYDRGRITLAFGNEEYMTFERSPEGGNYKSISGQPSYKQASNDWIKLSAKHAGGKDDNLSGLLLSKLDLFEKRIKKNKAGETNSLSFRDLARLIIVQESEIIKTESPFITGQYIKSTSETSVLKLLLTGIDDSSFVSTKLTEKQTASNSGKIELINEWLNDIHIEIKNREVKREDLKLQIDRLSKSIDLERDNLKEIQRDLNDVLGARKDLFDEKEKLNNRIEEIEELLSRFSLLQEHYQVDVERLESIKESGTLFIHQKVIPCPLCGALPEHQHVQETNTEDVPAIVNASIIEINKINILSDELKKTVSDLESELNSHQTRMEEIDRQYLSIDEKIRGSISPDLSKKRDFFSDLLNRKTELNEDLKLFERLDELENQKNAFLGTDIKKSSENQKDFGLSKTVLDDYSQIVLNILKAWNFPDADRVYFDNESFDFVINGKPRGSRGKGLRAITHAAVTIGLMEYCKTKSLPHPGFVVLDSPLLSYYGPEGAEDDLKGTDVKDKFYEYLVDKHSDSQIIIIENEHPQDDLLNNLQFIDFTKNPHEGRYGFFPINSK